MASAVANWGDDGRHYESLFVGVVGGGGRATGELPKGARRGGSVPTNMAPAAWRGGEALQRAAVAQRLPAVCRRPSHRAAQQALRRRERRSLHSLGCAFYASLMLLLSVGAYDACPPGYLPVGRRMMPSFFIGCSKNSRCIKLSRPQESRPLSERACSLLRANCTVFIRPRCAICPISIQQSFAASVR